MKHHLMIGTCWVEDRDCSRRYEERPLLIRARTPPGAIFTIAFDDEKLTLELVKRTEIPHDQPISWMTFDHSRKNIYGAGMKKWGSYVVRDPCTIEHQASHPMGGHPKANDTDTKTRAIFVLAAHLPPFAVYANPFYDHAGFLNVFGVDDHGCLDRNIQNAALDERSAIHGMVFDAAEEYLYSADMWANKIWCHKKDPRTGTLTLVGFITAPAPTDHPRWVEIHPSGRTLYVLMEAGNRLCTYAIDPSTHLPDPDSMSAHALIPPDFNTLIFPHQYRSDVAFLSHSGTHLFATARSNRAGLTGYLCAFALAPADGAIVRRVCMNPTPTGGGHSNAVSPCPWSDEWLALCDDEVGFVEMYRWKDELLGRVAHLDVKEPGFGMNAIWYD